MQSVYSPFPRTRGYTLIELMLVLALVAALAMMAWLGYLKYMHKGESVACTKKMVNMGVALAHYVSDKQEWPQEDVLNDADGKPLFPKAKILVAQEDGDYWLSQTVADGAPKEVQPFFKMARDSAAPYLSSGQWSTFTQGSVLVPGIKAVKANGHTPGHTAFAVESEGQKLLIWGDLVHAHAVQFARPGVSIEFDIDQKQAIATRRSIMKDMASSKSLVAGMHLPFPGLGHVRADGKGRYSWVPIGFAPMPKPANQ